VESVTVHTAKTTLSQLLARVEMGEEIVVSRGKHPVARLVPYHPVASKRRFGAMRGLITVAPAFFDPLPEQELAAWE
jgi:prevent-host-death family protein